jgi:hypothetical protein
MHRRSRAARIWSVALGIFAITALLSAVPASASHSWGNYHWARTRNPFPVQLGNNLDSRWSPYLEAVAADWSASSVLDTPVTAGRYGPGACGWTAGRVEVCNGAYGQTGWSGFARIGLTSDGHITQGQVQVNDTYARSDTGMRHVMCQEVGHTLGLGHTSEDGSSQNTCMDYSGSRTSTRPNGHDYDQLEAIYAHLDSTTTVGQSARALPAGASFINLDTPAEWGRLVADYGRVSVYVRELGGGRRIVTHVTWAEGHERGRGE